MAVLAISTLISSFLLSHTCTCFGLCNSLVRHICGDSYEGQLWAGEVIKGCQTARDIVTQRADSRPSVSQLAITQLTNHSIYQLCSIQCNNAPAATYAFPYSTPLSLFYLFYLFHLFSHFSLFSLLPPRLHLCNKQLSSLALMYNRKQVCGRRWRLHNVRV